MTKTMNICRILLLVCCPFLLLAQSSETQPQIFTLPEPGIYQGDLSKGNTISLDWADDSQIACFPATRFFEFQGNHVFFVYQMPGKAEVKITITPNNPNDRINLYALRQGVQRLVIPPDIKRAISCEAAYPLYVGKPNLQLPASPKSVEFLSPTRPYNIVIGVAGAKEVLTGTFKLEIELKTK